LLIVHIFLHSYCVLLSLFVTIQVIKLQYMLSMTTDESLIYTCYILLHAYSFSKLHFISFMSVMFPLVLRRCDLHLFRCNFRHYCHLFVISTIFMNSSLHVVLSYIHTFMLTSLFVQVVLALAGIITQTGHAHRAKIQ